MGHAGGKAAVYSGILRYTQDETGLAVVLGHEVGHAIAGHGNERMSQGLLAELGGMAMAVALSQKPQQTQSLFMTAYGAGTTVGFLLPYSRLEESEADHIGLILMARAGYDPRQAIPFWERMAKQEGHQLHLCKSNPNALATLPMFRVTQTEPSHHPGIRLIPIAYCNAGKAWDIIPRIENLSHLLILFSISSESSRSHFGPVFSVPGH